MENNRCHHCGTEIPGKRKDAVFCSKKCKQAAYRKRVKRKHYEEKCNYAYHIYQLKEQLMDTTRRLAKKLTQEMIRKNKDEARLWAKMLIEELRKENIENKP